MRGVRARFSRAVARLLLPAAQIHASGWPWACLPCGLIYAALLKAVDTGRSAGGRAHHAGLRTGHGGGAGRPRRRQRPSPEHAWAAGAIAWPPLA